MSWLVGNLLGGQNAGGGSGVPSDTLLQRLDDTLLLEERKKLIAQLKDNSSVDAVEHQAIGKSIPSLINILKIDQENTEVVKDTLEIFMNIMTLKGNGNNFEGSPLPQNSVEIINVDNFLKDAKNCTVILDLLEDKDYGVRYQVTQLLKILAINRIQQLQQCILVSPMGIARLMDLLRETRELIRNEALLVLLELTKSGSQEMQKIIAFEGAFEILLGIIYEEGLTEGGIVVQDSLQLINNLLKDNVSNQNYFRETSCIHKLPPLLQISNSDMWILTDDKTAILLLALRLISLLVTGNNPNAHNNQTVLCKHNILSMLIPLALGRINSIIIRTKALYTLGDIIYGNKENSTLFSTIMIPLQDATGNASNNTLPALSRLVTVALHAKEVQERAAAVRVFKCYLYENEEGQLALASTLTPPPTSSGETTIETSASIGTQLIHSLLGWEDSEELYPYRSWFSACVLSYILKDDATSKELVLKIPLEIPKSGVPLVTLLTKAMRSLTLCCRMAQQSTTLPPSNNPSIGGTNATIPTTVRPLLLVKVGLLRLLATWLDNCTPAVKAFLSSPSNLPFLVELIISSPASSPLDAEGQVHVQGLCCLLLGLCFQFNEDDPSSQFNKSSLHGIIMQRIGIDQFNSKLEALRKTEQFVKAEQGLADVNQSLVGEDVQQQIKQYQAHALSSFPLFYYDYDFTLFFKAAYDKIQKQLKSPKAYLAAPKVPKTPKEGSNVTSPVTTLHHSSTPAKTTSELSHEQPNVGANEAVLHSYKELIRQQDRELETLKQRNQELEALLKDVQQKQTENVPNTIPPQQQQVLLSTLTEREATISTLEKEVINLKQQIEQLQQETNDLPSSSDFDALSQAYSQLEAVLAQKDEQLKQQQHQILLAQQEKANNSNKNENNVILKEDALLLAQYKNQVAQLEEQMKGMEANLQVVSQERNTWKDQVTRLESSLQAEQQKFSSLEKEQEDLLMELANYEVENNNLKAKLSIYEGDEDQSLVEVDG